ncbi:MAG: hypothetical protein K0S70_796 [Microbacterium sp.]|nr:hypothetical protein [Microbacterium sp.]
MPNADKGPRRHEFTMPSTGQVIPVYAGVKVGRALDEVTEDMTVYQGVRLYEVLEAVYKQGLKDGAGLPNPGRPRLLP